MPARQCAFVVDLAELEKALQQPVSGYVDEFLKKRPEGDRLREYAELAFADEDQIQTLRKGDRETMVMARRLIVSDAPRPGVPEDARPAAEYLPTRTASQLKWFVHALGASGRLWVKEAVCGAPRDWVEEALNLLFTQRGFASTPEEAEEFRLTRQALLRFSGPFPVKEAGREVEDPNPVTTDEFPWRPREDGVMHFRLTPSFACSTVARTLATLDLSPQAFQDADRSPDPRLQGLVNTHVSRLRAYLQSGFARPALLSFIGS